MLAFNAGRTEFEKNTPTICKLKSQYKLQTLHEHLNICRILIIRMTMNKYVKRNLYNV